MRLAYLISWRGGAVTGPFKKMATQARIWSERGHDVGLFVATGAAAQPEWAALPAAQCVVATDRSGLWSNLQARREVLRAIADWEPDLVYLRHGTYTPGLRRTVRGVPTVLEINGDEVAIARQHSAMKARWTAATRGLVLSSAAGAVFMTQELAESGHFARYPFERVVIPNGVDLAETEQLAPSTSARPRLVMLGHPDSPWHGTDKLVELARRRPDWAFEVIGPTEHDLGAPPPPNVFLHSEMPESEYRPLLAISDVGFGTLAMHRIGAQENPALKVREYLGRGLAVILGCRDPDVQHPIDGILELPNTESNIADNVTVIEEFVSRWHGRRINRSDIAHFDLQTKESSRLAFFERFARQTPATRAEDGTLSA